MIKWVSIRLNFSLICGGLAIVERDGHSDCIDFDVAKGGEVPLVIVGGRGKRIPIEEAEQIERALLELFIKHQVPMEIGNYVISA
ncbi:hypothetical protein M2277_005628 [Paenibacillus sp. LBL]|uniref:hypothetical protein n=1 Tax=Paenibacillus sp. LBL TaxID=2940563 RepID=UPI0024741E1A|nr:hypothetical protein [Paenibacillus sp. LBL]MDH6674929.1 hypothetical protein [Paenibacillus sp. LBL]